MRKILILIMSVSLLAVACGDTEKKAEKKAEKSEEQILSEEIEEMEQQLFAEMEPNQEMAIEMIGKYVHFANKFPEHENAAEYYFKAAEIAMNFGQPNNAIKYLTNIEENYNDFDKYGSSIFLLAHIYNYYLMNNEKAEEYYNKFIDNYPEHALIEDAKAALTFIDMTDEQLIEFFSSIN